MATLGIDIGCISVKIAVVGGPSDREVFQELAAGSDLFHKPEAKGRILPSPDAPPILVTAYQRIKGSPTEAASKLLKQVMAALPEGTVTQMGVTGTGGKLVSTLLDLPYENEFRAIARAIGALHPDVTTVFEMGGETSKFIHLETDKSSGRVGIVDYGTNGDCAAGTGSFMDQQANRLLYDIEDVGDIVKGAGKAASIAGRCSVFAKSDMIHAQQKGYEPPEVLKGLCNAVVRNYRGTITKGKEIGELVAFIGGVAANKGAVAAMRESFELDQEHFMVPAYYAWMGAIGSALTVAEEQAGIQMVTVDPDRLTQGKTADFETADALSMDRVILLRDRVKPYEFPADGSRVGAYLGIDIGSVSTNLVLLDEAGEVIKEIYVKTDGRPVEVVNKGLSDIWNEMGPRLEILGVATTGSGRELIGELIGADTVNDEITAHKTGATFIGRKLIDRVPDTIFEIGGQDSKFISLQDGVVVDFAMNEACAAGTGSFLEEQAEKLGIKIIGEFAQLALSSKAPVRLGERCTVFMERDVNSYLQRGAHKKDLVAGLAYSIAYNYLNRLVGQRHIGKTIYFQGGTAYNDAVAAAFSQILDRDIIVPPYNGVVGAIGVALLAREKMSATHTPSRFRGWDLDKVDYKVREFTCHGCTNECDIRQFTIGDEKTYWGDKCSDRYRKRAKVDKKPVIRDLVEFRKDLMCSYVSQAEDNALLLRSGTDAPRGTMGLPRAMYTYERLPFWATFFKACGFDVMLSRQTDKMIREAGVDGSVAEPCFPIRVAHGHVSELLQEGADHIFLPNFLNEETDHPEMESHACPWGQTLPHVIRFAPQFEAQAHKIYDPILHFRRGPEFVGEALRESLKPLGVPGRVVDAALKEAYEAQTEFRGRLVAAGAEALALLEEKGELGIVLVGRPYNIYDSGVNMDIPAKLRRYYGANVIPLDFLPLWGIDTRDITPNMFWSYGRKILQAAKIVAQHPNLHIIYMTNFKCGPDSYVKHYIGVASPEPFLVLQFDEHTNDAGAMTRCEAYLDSKGFLRWWAREDRAKQPVREN
jgi:predicted CoA-substrate-specific enzyme activase